MAGTRSDVGSEASYALLLNSAQEPILGRYKDTNQLIYERGSRILGAYLNGGSISSRISPHVAVLTLVHYSGGRQNAHLPGHRGLELQLSEPSRYAQAILAHPSFPPPVISRSRHNQTGSQGAIVSPREVWNHSRRFLFGLCFVARSDKPQIYTRQTSSVDRKPPSTS